MTKSKTYSYTRFSSDVLKLAYNEISRIMDNNEDDIRLRNSLSLDHDDNSSWTYDDLNEFFADYRKFKNYANFRISSYTYGVEVTYYKSSKETKVTIETPSRKDIALISEIFEKHLKESKLPHEKQVIKPNIFIGHGRSSQWRDLKDHLQDKHGYKIEAYETGARAGHSIRDILEDMVSKSSFALLILTAEDEQADGSYRCRQNVVHETGLFQGKLGFHRAIVLIEDQVEEFSNIQGIQQIRYSKNNIKETFGEVLATLKREFK